MPLFFLNFSWLSLLRFLLVLLVAGVIVVYHCSSPFHTFGKAEIEKLESENGQSFSHPPSHMWKCRRSAELTFVIIFPHTKEAKITLKRKRNFFFWSDFTTKFVGPMEGESWVTAAWASRAFSAVWWWQTAQLCEERSGTLRLGIEGPTFVLSGTWANHCATVSPTHLKMQNERIAQVKDWCLKWQIKKRCVCVCVPVIVGSAWVVFDMPGL